MTNEEVVSHFGTWYKVTMQGGFSINAPTYWKKLGYIPTLSQMKLEKITQGKLVYREEDARGRNADTK